MMMRLFYCPTGIRGLTGEIFRKCLEGFKRAPRDFSSILYITPNPVKIRESGDVFHRAAGGGTYIPPVMTTLRQLSMNLCRSHSGSIVFPGYLKNPLIMALSGHGPGLSALLSDLIGELKTHLPGKGASETAGVLDAACLSLGIPPEIRERLGGAVDVMRRYDEALSSNRFIDGDDALAAALPHVRHLKIRLLILDGIYRLSPAEKLLARALIESSPNTWAVVPVDDRCPEAVSDYLAFLDSYSPEECFPPAEAPSPGLGYCAYASREEEVAAAARKIKAGFISGRYRDLSKVFVVFSSLSGYADMVERVFTKYGVPYTFPSGSNALRARRAEDLSSIFACAAEDYPVKKLSHLLSSPFFADVPETLRKWAPKATLSGVHGGLSAWLSSEGTPSGELLWLDRRLKPIRRAVSRGEGHAGVLRAYLNALRSLGFNSEGFDSEFEDRLKALAFLDSVGAAAPGTADFGDLLGSIIKSVPGEEEGTGVRIMGFGEAEGIEADHLYLCGLRDGEMPSRPDMDFFLPEKLRAELGLRTMKTHLLLEEFNFRRLVGSASRAHLSFTETEGDKVFLPSLFISEGTRVSEPVYGVFSAEEKLVREGRKPYAFSIRQVRMKQNPLGKGRRYRVTEMDGFRTCPRKFFIEGVMGLEPLEAKRYELDPKTAGTIVHAVMEGLAPRAGLEYGEFRRLAEELMDRALLRAHLEPYWKDLLRESFLAVLPDVYEIERDFKKEGFSFEKAELDLKGEIAGVALKGKIDRIDARDGTHQIIDYKTGNIDLNPGGLLNRGASLQLFLYAALARQHGFNPERVGIYSLRQMKTRFIPSGADSKAGRTLDHYIEAATGYLLETLGMLGEGDFRAMPLAEQTCRHCHERPYCPFIQGEAKEGR